MSVQEALDARVADLKDEVTSGLVLDPKKLRQQIELCLGHDNARYEEEAIILDDLLTGVDELLYSVLLCLGKISQSSGCFLLIILVSGKSDVADLQHGHKQAAIMVTSKDGLSEVSPVLLVEAFAELDGSQSPLTSVQFEVGYYPRGLALLPVREVGNSSLNPDASC